MKRTIKVYLGNEARLVGLLRYDIQGARESAAFEYDAAWLAAENRFPIEPVCRLFLEPIFIARLRTTRFFMPP